MILNILTTAAFLHLALAMYPLDHVCPVAATPPSLHLALSMRCCLTPTIAPLAPLFLLLTPPISSCCLAPSRPGLLRRRPISPLRHCLALPVTTLLSRPSCRCAAISTLPLPRCTISSLCCWVSVPSQHLKAFFMGTMTNASSNYCTGLWNGMVLPNLECTPR